MVSLGVGGGEAHIALLVDGVVALLVGAGGVGDAGRVEAGIAEHHVEGIGAAAAPAPDGHAGGVDEGVRGGEGANRFRLLLCGEDAERAVASVAPIAAARRRCALVVEADDDVAFARDEVEEEILNVLRVEDGDGGGFSIDVGEDWIFFGGIEMRRFDDLGAEREVVVDGGVGELDGSFERVEFSGYLGIFRDGADGDSVGETGKGEPWSDVSGGKAFEGVEAVG